MTKRHPESGDWSRASESLFHSARTLYGPTDADRERVRNALAQRLSEAADMPAPGAEASNTLAPASALGKLVKIAIGAAVVVAGAVAFVHLGEGDRVEPPPMAARPPAPTAPRAASTPPIAERPAIEGAPANDAPVVKPPSDPPSRANRRASERTAAGELAAPTPAATVPPAPSERPVAPGPRVEPKRRPAEPAQAAARVRSTETSPATSTPAANTTPVVPAAASRAEQAREENASDARAELAWMARIDAALRKSKLTTVLSLCAEHARRWPRGSFVQEREALGAIAACRSDARDAETRAARFFQSYPRAPLGPRVEEACRPRAEKERTAR